jgi:hypothetical protein
MKISHLSKILIACTFITGIAIKANSQNCNIYFPTVKGTVYEMQQFDSKDKLTGTNTYSVTNAVTTTEGNTTTNIHSSWKGKTDKDTSSANIAYKCEGGKVYIDMKNFMPAGSAGQSNGMEIKTDASYIEIPQTLTVGMTMADATMTMSMYSNGTLFSTTKITISDRKVESTESITTPAGTFQCYKVTYNTTTETNAMGMKMSSEGKGVEYYCSGTGMVKSETYNKNGKLEGYSVLSKITLP